MTDANEGRRRVKVDYFQTFAVEYIVLLATMYLYRLSSEQWGAIGLAEYAIARRTVSLLEPIIALGTGVGLQYFIPRSRQSPNRIPRYVTTAFVMLLASGSTVCLALNAAPESTALVFFGDSERWPMVLPVSIMALGAAGHTLYYGYLRARGQFAGANVFRLATLGAVPLISLLTFRASITMALAWTGIGWVVTALMFLAYSHPTLSRPTPSNLSNRFFRYGWQRVPGDLLQVGFLTGPVVLVTHLGGIEVGGTTAVGIAFVTLVGALVAPAGAVLLPVAARLLERGQLAELQKYARGSLVIALIVSGVAAIAIGLAAEWILRDLLKIASADGPGDVRLILGGAVPYAVYLAGRRIVDAMHEAATNTRNTFLGFLVFVLVSTAGTLFGGTYHVVLIAFVLGQVLLAVMTVSEIVRASSARGGDRGKTVEDGWAG